MHISSARLQASMFGLRPTKLLFPDRMAMDQRRITITRRTWLGLRKSENEILIAKVASVQLDNGILNSTVLCETQGGSNINVGLSVVPRNKAKGFAAELRQRVEAMGG